MRRRGITLVEIAVVLAIIGIGLVLFYSVCFMNWMSLEQQMSVVDLQMEADIIVSMISNDAKLSRQIIVDPSGKAVTFNYPVFDPPVGTIVYSLTPQGQITRNDTVISSYIDFNNSSFAKDSSALVVNLLLTGASFGRRLELPVSTEVYPRNLL
ncbi:MAG: prepilin-type N-terminal cleavage/methylation domain-containing protein [Candidatus Omnitrophica bacterium]|nr:prepilin-type N-terminal cleavage/methylation domain-containing protein [Candidatus Omnitrophota bacterium]